MAASARSAGSLVCAAALLLAAVGCAELRARVAEFLPEPTIDFEREVELVPPEGLRITSTPDRQVALAWDPVLIGDVAGYAIIRARVASGPYIPVGRTSSRFETVFVDGGDDGKLGDGQTYYYRIHPYDGEGRVSKSHVFAKASTLPPPEPPRELQVYSNLPRLAVLRWEPSPSSNVAGYVVLRGPTMAGPWERVTFVPGALHTVYEDRVPGDLRVLYYRLRGVNRFGGESEMTEPVRAVTKAEPLPPVGLTVAESRVGRIRLRWEPNVESDIAHYLVLRMTRGEDAWNKEQSVADVAAPAIEWVDTEVGCAERVRYRLRAVDADGLASANSRPLETVGPDIGLELRGLELAWDATRTRGWTRARVYERRQLLPDSLLGEVAADESFPLTALSPGPHELVVVLTRPHVSKGASDASGQPLPGADSLDTTPPCRLRLELPAAALERVQPPT